MRLAPRISLAVLAFLTTSCGPQFVQQVFDSSPPTDPWMKAVGDLNGDGRVDLILCGRVGPLVWYEGPTWQKRTISTATGSQNTSNDIAIGDVDRNGSQDVVLANGIWFANPAPAGDPERDAWARHQIDATKGHDVLLGDLDRDGDLDLVKRHQNGTGDVIRVFRQNTGGTWTERDIPSYDGEGLALADLDADGDPDIVIAGVWYENDGNPISGAWTERRYTASYTHTKVVVQVANLGGSARPDILLTPAEAAGQRYRISWFEAPANARNVWPERILVNDVEAVVHGLAVADFDRDGRNDFAYAEMDQGADPDLVMLNLQRSAGFWTAFQIATGASHNIEAADLDGDGRIDLFGANWDTSQAPDSADAKIWLNRMP
jgi:hypothetical protein